MEPSTTPDALVCSVCIANYNGFGIIRNCINSVLAQDCDFDFEIIVHDDASTDNSVDIIRLEFPDIRLLSSDTNVGFCTSNNRMVETARGRYILLLNNDAMLFPDALQSLHREACSAETAVLGLPQYDARTGEFIDNGYYCDIFANPIPNRSRTRSNDVAFVSGACLWIPKVLWQETHGFPEWFGSVAEDMYLCTRLRLAGHPVIALGESGFHHHIGFSLGGGKVTGKKRLATTIRRRAFSERNKTFVMILTYPLCALLPILPAHLALLITEGIFISIAKQDRRIWKKIYSPVIPSILDARKHLCKLRNEIQQQRSVSFYDWSRSFRLTFHKLKLILKHGLPELR